MGNPANYSLVGLSNTLYNVYASLIQQRLCLGLDHSLWGTQYGFRQKRSTVQPRFVARRLQNQAEQTGDNLSLVFPDWENLFDQVDQAKLVEATFRIGVPKKMKDILASFHINPRFRVKARERKSSYSLTGLVSGRAALCHHTCSFVQ